jgi:ATP-dependent helicase HrpB
MSESLPIDDYLGAIAGHVRASRAVVVIAAAGAGKTTRVAPALAADGPVLLLQPRRVAARAIARRIADERGWTVGREVGWHVRFDRRSSPDTRLLVVTEGMLTVRLQQDPLLSDVRTVVIDEFHERSIHADLGLALAREAWRARSDLRLVIMSATLDPSAISAFLDDCPIVDVPGRLFPLNITYRPHVTVEQAVSDLWRHASAVAGAALCFLPGAPEIRRAAEALAPAARAAGVQVLPLHGGLDAEAQDAAIRPSASPRVILATNIAETTLTVPDVTRVVDTGLHKVARYDPARAVDSLDLERISLDSADQRAGRAGRTGPGEVIRLWDPRDRLRPYREPDIARVDLAGPVLDVIAWGGDPRTLEWFQAPPDTALAAALALLTRLGALDTAGGLTATGRRMQRLPLHPRLARLVLAAGGSEQAAAACALLSERHFVPARRQTTSCDLLAAIEQPGQLPAHAVHAARQIRHAARDVLGAQIVERSDEPSFRRAVLAAYPDRVARRRAPRGDRLVLASGTGARLARESGVHNAELLVAVEVTSGPDGEVFVRLATGIEREWLAASSRTIVHHFDQASGAVRASVIERYDELVLSEHPCAPDPGEAARLVADEYARRGPTGADSRLLRRLEFAGIDVTFESLARAAAAGARRIDDVDLEAHVPADARRRLDRDAPAAISVPSGRSVRLDYRESGVVAAVKLQEVFGLAETPRVGPRRVPITFELLAPNGRPVQVTSDLRSFWTRGYPEVRKELRARYPRHPWPDDPWTAPATRRVKPRGQ